MTIRHRSILFSALALALALALTLALAGAAFLLPATAAPPVAAASTSGDQVAVFAGGCFWGVEAVYEHVKGVKQVTSGNAGGTAETARYPIVSSGETRHAESVKVVYDPAQVSYGQMLTVFFSVAHDPTQLNRQGPDSGPQYRSAVFYGNAAQQAAANAYIAQLGRGKMFDRPVVMQVVPLTAFYPAEAYHQDYARLSPLDPCIVINDAPRVWHLKSQLPDLTSAAERLRVYRHWSIDAPEPLAPSAVATAAPAIFTGPRPFVTAPFASTGPAIADIGAGQCHARVRSAIFTFLTDSGACSIVTPSLIDMGNSQSSCGDGP